MRRLVQLGLWLLVMAVCLGACSLGTNKGPRGEPKRTDDFTLNTEKRDLTERLQKNPDSFQERDDYSLTATVRVSPQSDLDRIIYEISVKEARVPMVNVIQSFTLDPSLMNSINAIELFNSNVGNTHETTMGPGKEPLGLSLLRDYILKPKAEIHSNIINTYQDMYVKISYGPYDQRTEDYIHVKAEPSPETVEYMKSWNTDQ
ncbi:hypothetical protein DC345_10470 [Paenibacillus taichungensis]|uniref:Uncharacterized protein n=1 Tax=Paenibacillus taichungensis TaxID=484184 RepID=A0A329QX82_9BACL|nr:hypothetical protein [Paenibacillus taichungensis]RAW15922.1 hypothetical protein DC345_10470 [Paenibacillus taichungensis]